ncbi:MAG TPA: MBL fold metallo-hydrolase [Vicinamibacteria bacterium]|nr:MBL fold metallo-hydrolase [Vicinamibacteria bacterium]
MRIHFLGAARTVTGSQYVVEADGRAVMVDCGMFQGEKELRLRNWAEPAMDPARLEALILTHTHLDHIGRVPRLVKQGFAGPIYCTPPTLELAKVLLEDAAHLQLEDAEYLNRKGLTKHKPALPLFDGQDVERALALFEGVPLGREQRVSDTFRFTYLDAGHLLGAASAHLAARESGRSVRVLFSGDVGRYDAILTRDPEPCPDTDYVVVESTYGNRSHAHVPILDQLQGVLERTFSRGGVLLIPAFAVGRAQQMLFLMDQLVSAGRTRPFPIHVDSPMAIDATRIYASFPEAHRVSLSGALGRSAFHSKWVHYHRTRDESQKLNEMKGPAVIVSSSGMLSGGRILHHCRVRLPKPENTLLITGYQAASTLGRALLDRARFVRIHKTQVPVLAEVTDLKGMSGHADASELVRWLAAVRSAKRVFVTHGEDDAALALCARVAKERGLPAHAPEMGESVEL